MTANWKEANIVINSKVLTFAESMTLRVAVSTFLMGLQQDGLGTDETGKQICHGYKLACMSILETMR